MRPGQPLGPLLLLIVLHCAICRADNNARLGTTFGGPNKNPPATATPPPPKGKECKTVSDCNVFVNTTCMQDPRDSKMRCLCGDTNPPKNGQCRNAHRVLRFPCNVDSECIEHARCAYPSNSTSNMTSIATANLNPNVKVCLCREEFEEEDLHCGNGADAAIISLALLLASVSLHLSKVHWNSLAVLVK